MAYVNIENLLRVPLRYSIDKVVQIDGIIYATAFRTIKGGEDDGCIEDTILKWKSGPQKWEICAGDDSVLVYAYVQGYTRQELLDEWGYDFPQLDEQLDEQRE